MDSRDGIFNRFSSEVFTDDILGSLTGYNDSNGNLWFDGMEVSRILGYDKTYHMYEKIDASDKLQVSAGNKGRGGCHTRTMLSEAGLYTAIFSSRKKEARDFMLWVTKTVLPELRQHGGYIISQEYLPDREREELTSDIRALSSKIEKVTEKEREKHLKWKKAVAEKNIAQEKVRVLRRELTVWKEDVSSTEKVLDATISNLGEAMSNIRSLQEKLEYAKNPEKYEKEKAARDEAARVEREAYKNSEYYVDIKTGLVSHKKKNGDDFFAGDSDR